SRQLVTPIGKCVERIEARAFGRALARAANVDLMLNHGRRLGGTKDKNLELFEDSIGLRAICTVTDADVIKKARAGTLRGWSFGFAAKGERVEERAGDVPRRIISELDLKEVSIIDGDMTPCYPATSIELRGGEQELTERRYTEFPEVRTVAAPDYTEVEIRLNKLKK
ncbi:MAG: HK97 family phage prohead protease, partial [Defluviitaleaceae bacterium]|nr:HK97 family phage prohead protease [Defluviitaleaceae bacterium]